MSGKLFFNVYPTTCLDNSKPEPFNPITPFWADDLSILYKEPDFIPQKDSNTNQKLNALARLSILLFIVFYLITRNSNTIFIPIITLIWTLYRHNNVDVEEPLWNINDPPVPAAKSTAAAMAAEYPYPDVNAEVKKCMETNMAGPNCDTALLSKALATGPPPTSFGKVCQANTKNASPPNFTDPLKPEPNKGQLINVSEKHKEAIKNIFDKMSKRDTGVNQGLHRNNINYFKSVSQLQGECVNNRNTNATVIDPMCLMKEGGTYKALYGDVRRHIVI